MSEYIKQTLDEIKSLHYNWNDNGAGPFNRELLDLAYKFANRLKEVFKKDPFITPTAIQAIQMEYEFKNDIYLEFEVHLNRIAIMIMHGNSSMEVIIHKAHITKDIDKLENRLNAFIDILKADKIEIPEFDMEQLKTTATWLCSIFDTELEYE